ncbi:MAG: UDP-glucose/GDP-mannose dehydrogenase family protein [Candidatus Saganbacteria bacterium]|nr:UDP-glucose/GDP-mannose dehydrogenase family protein [Candidatus Saganbacteria bacterium]
MRICVIGVGYVGLVTAACLADLGNEVVCVDSNKKKISALKKGRVPFYEPGLKELVVHNLKNKRLAFTGDLTLTVNKAEIIFIAVGTPPKATGEADVTAVIQVTKGIARAIKSKGIKVRKSSLGYKLIVNKSTVPVGMGDLVTETLLKYGIPKKSFAVVSNPEFLREGSALSDFRSPDRLVIGASNNKAFNLITDLYRPLNAHIIFTSIKNAELIKYASNAFLATKISFINEMANICERLGADIIEVAFGMGLDKRIGRGFLNAGVGFGGSCFPKDISALIHLAKSHGYEPVILKSTNEFNRSQREAFVSKVEKKLKGLKNKTIGVLGLSFKPQTDDLRDAPSLDIIAGLRGKGAKVKVYDPIAMNAAKNILREVTFCKNAYQAAEGSHALLIITEWDEFKELDLSRIKTSMKMPVLIDGRNIYDPRRMREMGFQYTGTGR